MSETPKLVGGTKREQHMRYISGLRSGTGHFIGTTTEWKQCEPWNPLAMTPMRDLFSPPWNETCLRIRRPTTPCLPYLRIRSGTPVASTACRQSKKTHLEEPVRESHSETCTETSILHDTGRASSNVHVYVLLPSSDIDDRVSTCM